MKFRNFSHSFDQLKRNIILIIGSFNYINVFWWGINIGKKNRFSGRTYFKRYPNSIIMIGDNCTFLSKSNSNLIGINRACTISTLTENAIIEIGDNCGFSGTVIGAFIKIKIGDNVKCGANTLITDSDWHLDDYRSGKPADVIIEDNVWIGEGVKILKGVKIGKNSIIGAGSVVIKSVPENTVAAGNPCKTIKLLDVIK